MMTNGSVLRVWMGRFWWAFCGLLMLIPIQIRAAEQSPRQLVESVTSKLIETLQSHQSEIRNDPKAVYPILENILLPYADFREMSQRVLASHWRNLSNQEQDDFIEAFRVLVLRTYSRVFSHYKGQTVTFLEPRAQDAQDDRVQVRSVVNQPDGPSVSVDYRLIQHKAQWFVYDLSIDGISLVASYRGQFGSSIENKGFSAVLSELKEHNLETLDSR